MTLTTRTRNTRRRDLSANYSRSFPRRRCPTDSSIAPDGSGIKPVSKENNRELFSLTFVSTFDIREVEPSPLDDNTEENQLSTRYIVKISSILDQINCTFRCRRPDGLA